MEDDIVRQVVLIDIAEEAHRFGYNPQNTTRAAGTVYDNACEAVPKGRAFSISNSNSTAVCSADTSMLIQIQSMQQCSPFFIRLISLCGHRPSENDQVGDLDAIEADTKQTPLFNNSSTTHCQECFGYAIIMYSALYLGAVTDIAHPILFLVCTLFNCSSKPIMNFPSKV